MILADSQTAEHAVELGIMALTSLLPTGYGAALLFNVRGLVDALVDPPSRLTTR